jgi:site-specific recombinase XerD
LLGRGRSFRTAKAYASDLKVLLDETGVTSIPATEYEEVGMNWLTANRNRVAAKTTGRRLTSLRQFAKWARWTHVSFDDYTPPVPLKGQPHPLPEGIEGVKRMIEVCNTTSHASLIALCGLCGLRVSEALQVRPSHFDLQTMELTVRGKGDKERVVPVSKYAWEVLQIAVTKAFCDNDREVIGLKDRFARALVTQLGVRAGLKRHVASHDLRATFATAVYDKTLDKRLVQVLLGHASGDTTDVYINRSKTQMRDGVEL